MKTDFTKTPGHPCYNDDKIWGWLIIGGALLWPIVGAILSVIFEF